LPYWGISFGEIVSHLRSLDKPKVLPQTFRHGRAADFSPRAERDDWRVVARLHVLACRDAHADRRDTTASGEARRDPRSAATEAPPETSPVSDDGRDAVPESDGVIDVIDHLALQVRRLAEATVDIAAAIRDVAVAIGNRP
jgi:hypothetical protein